MDYLNKRKTKYYCSEIIRKTKIYETNLNLSEQNKKKRNTKTCVSVMEYKRD